MSRKARLALQAAKKAAKEGKKKNKQSVKQPSDIKTPAAPPPEPGLSAEAIELLSQLDPEHQQILAEVFAKKQYSLKSNECPVIDCKKCCALIEELMPADVKEAAAASGIKNGVFTAAGEYLAVDEMTPAAVQQWRKDWRDRLYVDEDFHEMLGASATSNTHDAKKPRDESAVTAAKEKRKEHEQLSTLAAKNKTPRGMKPMIMDLSKAYEPLAEGYNQAAKHAQHTAKKAADAPQAQKPDVSTHSSLNSSEKELASVDTALARLEGTMKDMKIFIVEQKREMVPWEEKKFLLEDLSPDKPGPDAHHEMASPTVAKHAPKVKVVKKDGLSHYTVRTLDVARISTLMAHLMDYIECDIQLQRNVTDVATVLKNENKSNFMSVVYGICRSLCTDFGFDCAPLEDDMHALLMQRFECLLSYFAVHSPQHWEGELKLKLTEEVRKMRPLSAT